MRTLFDLINSNDAVSEVLGYILIFGMVLTMAGLIFTVAMPSIENAQEHAYFESIKRGITVFDSKASMVALGESPAQIVNIDSKGGIFEVNQSASSISIVMNETDTPIFDGDLGTLTYELGDTVIAYEGGGVWMKYPKGDSVMISPPEFHYNGETLTLPLIRLRGNEHTSGTGTVQFKISKNNSEIRFPNSGINTSFTNPVAGSKDILITIQSDYYKAWAKYMEERTEVQGITTNDANHEVSAMLNIKPSDVAVDLAGNIIVYDIDDTVSDPITNFKLNLTDPDSSKMHNLNLELSTDAANPQLIIGFSWSSNFSITITYVDEDGYTEKWVTEVDGSAKEYNEEFDLLSGAEAKLESSNTKSWGNDQSSNEPGLDYNKSDVLTLNNVTQHYMSIMPAPFELKAYNNGGGGSKVNLSISTVVLNYAVAPPRLTYLHIVAHDISVGIS